MTEQLTHDKRRDCTRYGEPINTENAEKRNCEGFHRCPICGAALSDAPVVGF